MVPWTQTRLITNGFSTPAEWGVSSPRTINSVVWHDMEGYLEGAIAHWNRGAAGAHICILRDGTVVLTCELENIAWHAGTSNQPGSSTYGRTPFWRANNINPSSVGIELEGFVATGYTKEQINACVKVGTYLRRKYGIPTGDALEKLAGHHLHRDISAMRLDPGPLFPYQDILRRIKGQAG